MKRRLLNFLTALSLLLCVAVVALWARSYFRTDALHLTRLSVADDPSEYAAGVLLDRHAGVCLSATRGHAVMIARDYFFTAGAVPSWHIGWHSADARDAVGHSRQNRMLCGRSGPPGREWTAVVPLFVPSLVTAVLPVVWLVNLLRRRRSAARGFPVDTATPTA